jgi:hypothetical protein
MHLVDRETALGKRLQHFASDGTGGADNSYSISHVILVFMTPNSMPGVNMILRR